MKNAIVTEEHVVKIASDITKLWKAALTNIMECSKLFVRFVDEFPTLAAELCQELNKAGIGNAIISKLDAVGRGRVDARLPAGEGGPHSNKISKLLMPEQRNVLDGAMYKYLQPDGQTRMVCLRECLDSEAKQLFNGRHIRNLAEQKAYIEEEKAQQNVLGDLPKQPWVITKTELIFPRGARLKKTEAKRLLMDFLR